MTCAHCAGRVDQAIRASGLASQIQVDLGRQQVRMVPATGGDMGLDALRREVSRLVVQAGYEVPESSSTGN
jgi:copper chaperone CopZ